MAASKKGKKKEYLNADNATSVANRGLNPAYTQSHGQPVKNADTGKWENGPMVTKTKSGLMSVDGRKAGGSTWTYTPKNDDGSPVLKKDGTARQSGRSQIANRNQRTYDTKAGLNNISPRVVQAWLEQGLAREVEGGGLDVGGNVIYQKANGNYSMGLTNG